MSNHYVNFALSFALGMYGALVFGPASLTLTIPAMVLGAWATGR